MCFATKEEDERAVESIGYILERKEDSNKDCHLEINLGSNSWHDQLQSAFLHRGEVATSNASFQGQSQEQGLIQSGLIQMVPSLHPHNSFANVVASSSSSLTEKACTLKSGDISKVQVVPWVVEGKKTMSCRLVGLK